MIGVFKIFFVSSWFLTLYKIYNSKDFIVQFQWSSDTLQLLRVFPLVSISFSGISYNKEGGNKKSNQIFTDLYVS